MFLCSSELVSVRMEWILSGLFPLWWWLSPIYSGLGPLPKCKAGRDPTTAKFEGRQLVHAILTKVVFACKSHWS